MFFGDNFLKIVDPDHGNFIDLSTFGRIICEEDVVIDRDQPLRITKSVTVPSQLVRSTTNWNRPSTK